MKFRLIFALIAAVFTVACGGVESAVSPIDPDANNITIVTARMLDSSIGNAQVYVGTSVDTTKIDQSFGLSFVPSGTTGASFLVNRGDKGKIALTFYGSIGLLNMNNVPSTYMFQSDWGATSLSNFEIEKTSDVYFRLASYVTDVNGRFISGLPLSLSHQTTQVGNPSYTVKVPTQNNLAMFYYPSQVYTFSCMGNGVAYFGAKNGLTVIYSSYGNVMKYIAPPEPVPQVKLTCATYSSVTAARLANPTLNLSESK